MSDYTEFRSVISNLLRLRGATKEMTLEELEVCFDKFQQVVEARREEAMLIEQKEEEKRVKIDALRKEMIEAGISPEDIATSLTKTGTKKSSRPKLPKKYVITDNEGNEVRWSGVGLAPKPFKLAMDKGQQKSEFLDPNYKS